MSWGLPGTSQPCSQWDSHLLGLPWPTTMCQDGLHNRGFFSPGSRGQSPRSRCWQTGFSWDLLTWFRWPPAGYVHISLGVISILKDASHTKSVSTHWASSAFLISTKPERSRPRSTLCGYLQATVRTSSHVASVESLWTHSNLDLWHVKLLTGPKNQKTKGHLASNPNSRFRFPDGHNGWANLNPQSEIASGLQRGGQNLQTWTIF